MDHAHIDRVNILAATMQAMREATLRLPGDRRDFVLVDGNRVPQVKCCCAHAHTRGALTHTPRDRQVALTSRRRDARGSLHALSTRLFGRVASSRPGVTRAVGWCVCGGLPQDLPAPAKAVVRGDALVYCIAAASILAKVRAFPTVGSRSHRLAGPQPLVRGRRP